MEVHVWPVRVRKNHYNVFNTVETHGAGRTKAGEEDMRAETEGV